MTKDTCPLDGVWYHKLCAEFSTHKANDSFAACSHRNDCAHLKEIIETDKNQSAWVTKAILVNGIPNKFNLQTKPSPDKGLADDD